MRQERVLEEILGTVRGTGGEYTILAVYGRPELAEMA